jgi:hypothetical protein
MLPADDLRGVVDKLFNSAATLSAKNNRNVFEYRNAKGFSGALVRDIVFGIDASQMSQWRKDSLSKDGPRAQLKFTEKLARIFSGTEKVGQFAQEEADRVFAFWKAECSEDLSCAVGGLHQYASELEQLFIESIRKRRLGDGTTRVDVPIYLKVHEAGMSTAESEEHPLEARMTFAKQIPNEQVLRHVYEFDEVAYGKKMAADEQLSDAPNNIPFSQFENWWKAFPPGFLYSSKHSNPIAVVGMFPVPEVWAAQFVSRRVSEIDLSPEIIRAAKEGPRTHWYFSGISATEEGRGIYLPRVLGHALLEWVRFNADIIGDRKITVVSEGTTQIGQDLLANLAQFELASAPSSVLERPRYILFTSIEEVKRVLKRKPFFVSSSGLQKEVELFL